jgi:hypothetical protein
MQEKSSLQKQWMNDQREMIFFHPAENISCYRNIMKLQTVCAKVKKLPGTGL